MSPGQMLLGQISPCQLESVKDGPTTLPLKGSRRKVRAELSPRHLSRQHLSWGHLSISTISQLLQARFWSNFKQRVLGTCTTDYNCHHNICPGNICPGDNCPYKQLLSFPSWTLSTSVLFVKHFLNIYWPISAHNSPEKLESWASSFYLLMMIQTQKINFQTKTSFGSCSFWAVDKSTTGHLQ